MEDARIVELFWARSEKAIEETSSKYGKYCYTIAYSILANSEDAEESVNDTYLTAWNCMPPHRPAILSAFLGKITRRVSIDKWRRRTAEKRGGGEIAEVLDELSTCVPSNQNVEHEIETAELAKELNDFLKSIPPIQRQVFTCRYWYLDSIPDIARRFGFSEGTTKMMLYRTRKRLTKYLVKRGVVCDY